MKTIPIRAEERARKGKGGARETRRNGRIPCILYGQGESIALSVDRREFARALMEAHSQNIIFDLTLPGREPLKSIPREIQHDPVSRSMIHVDFQHIDMTKKITVRVAVKVVGEPDGVKNQGGILEHIARELEVSCLPSEIPNEIVVDVSHLVIGTSVHVSELSVEGFEILEDPQQVVALVVAPTVEKVVTPETPVEGAPVEGAPEAAPAAEGDAEKE
ncbi:MAG: 50S ribosomal protein L25 [bacterium]